MGEVGERDQGTRGRVMTDGSRKDDFYIRPISKKTAGVVLNRYHYLKDISRGFRAGDNYGLFSTARQEIAGVCVFTGFSVPELVVGMFGLERTDQEGFYELSRLCLVPDYQRQEHNLASWFVARTIRALRKDRRVRAILSYADSKYHKGTIYQACNFRYYGLTDPKSDFFACAAEGLVKQSRGRTVGKEGEWVERSRKHRYVLIYDSSLKILWKECDPKTIEQPERPQLKEETDQQARLF